jgi:hypothetical protein
VSGLDNTKQIWDTLKISHEGNDATMITKMELVEGELGRFAMIRGDEPTQTYNRLKTLVNKIRNYGSTRWTDHDVVRLMLRSFTVIDPHLKATNNKEALPSKVAQVEAVGLNEDEMALIIKRFKTALKGRKEYPNKNRSRGNSSCFKCGKSGHFIAQCPDNNNDQAQEKYGKKERKKNYMKAKGETHFGKNLLL